MGQRNGLVVHEQRKRYNNNKQKEEVKEKDRCGFSWKKKGTYVRPSTRGFAVYGLWEKPSNHQKRNSWGK